MEISKEHINADLERDELSRRVDAAQAWLDGAAAVIERTGNQEASELANHALNEVSVCMPASGSSVRLVQGGPRPSLLLVPVFLEDRSTGPSAQAIADNATLGRYIENKPGILFLGDPAALSPLLRGVVMLHEAKHAYYFENDEFRKGDPNDHWWEELDAWEFELELITAVGGQAYEQMIQTNLPRFIEAFGVTHERGGTILAPNLVNGIEALDGTFGRSASEIEARIRRQIARMDVVFRLFDQLYPENARVEKMRFLKQLHDH